MSILEAARRDAEQWVGTQESLSKDVCGSANGLRHKLSGFKGAKLSVEDALSLMLLTRGRHTITEMCRELGGVFVELPPPEEPVENTDLLAESQAITVRMAELFDSVNTAITKHNEIDTGYRLHIQDRGQALTEQVVKYLTLLMQIYGTEQPAAPVREVQKAKAG
ncbi:phage regulatory CII family protein [Aquitalea magnusonii]|uniref:Phage protein n=1 Tax=Aquitalea magnusonii TaxID=332411 RepID=A0A318JND3_9NEIS|nr:phage regulatory CII family protein [Aquitalea magnusonii]PXX49394.1 hypothetical protein DFR38_10434 [Aquitalea magnusonii]